MKKKSIGAILTGFGIVGFLLVMGGVGGIEIDSISLAKGALVSLSGLGILTLVVFIGIPYYNSLSEFRITTVFKLNFTL
jgi:hypothetical protein